MLSKTRRRDATAGKTKGGRPLLDTKFSCCATSARVLCAPFASRTYAARAGKRESERGTEKHEGMGSKHAKKAREKAQLSNAKMKAFPASPANASKTVQKATLWRSLLHLYAPPRGSTITQQQKRRENRRPQSRNAQLAQSVAAPCPPSSGWISLQTMSPKPLQPPGTVAAAAGNAGTAEHQRPKSPRRYRVKRRKERRRRRCRRLRGLRRPLRQPNRRTKWPAGTAPPRSPRHPSVQK